MLVILTILTVHQTMDRWNFRVPRLALTKTHSRAIAPEKIPKWSLFRFEPYESNSPSEEWDSDDAEVQESKSFAKI